MAVITSAVIVASATVYAASEASKNAAEARKDAKEARAQAAEEARLAREEARLAREEQLAWEREQYQDWQNIYGGLEENLSDYYNTLSADTIAVEQLENFAFERDAALDRMRTQLAQRGIESSGITAAAELSSSLASAEAGAQIRSSAPRQAAQEKQAFLQTGLAQNPKAGIRNAYAQNVNAVQQEGTNRTNRAYNFAAQQDGYAISATQASDQATQDAIESVTGVIETYGAETRQPTKQAVTTTNGKTTVGGS